MIEGWFFSVDHLKHSLQNERKVERYIYILRDRKTQVRRQTDRVEDGDLEQERERGKHR